MKTKSTEEWAKGLAAYAHPDTRDMVESAAIAALTNHTNDKLREVMKVAERMKYSSGNSLSQDDCAEILLEEIESLLQAEIDK